MFQLFVVNFPPPYSEGGEECIKPNDKEKKDVDEMMIEAQMYFRNGVSTEHDNNSFSIVDTLRSVVGYRYETRAKWTCRTNEGL